MARVVTVGAAVQDVFLSNSDAFAPVCINPDTCFEMLEIGSKADVNTIFFGTGGGATNAAVTFARQGFDVRFMGVIGRDPAGQSVLDELDQENVNTELLKYSDTHSTGYSVLLVAPNGERTILTYRGASTHYRLEDINLDGVETWHVSRPVASDYVAHGRLQRRNLSRHTRRESHCRNCAALRR